MSYLRHPISSCPPELIGFRPSSLAAKDTHRMSWFMRQRQDFIRAHLETFGMIRRADIASRFEVTTQVASKDIQDFIAAHPDAIDYDRMAKCYTLDRTAIASAEGGA